MSSERRATPEVTVSMPAYGSVAYIRQAIDSVLMQQGIELELVVVDDASNDDLAAIVRSYDDPRLRLLRNERRRGIPFCHNLVLRHSRAAAIAHVDSDDFLIRPDALRLMVDRLLANARLGQVHCYFIDVDDAGRLSRDAASARWAAFHATRRPGMDYRTQLLTVGTVINHLRTYRRALFERVGGFNEALRLGTDHEMALRILDYYEIEVVPQFLYARRIHATNSENNLRLRALRSWAARVRNVHRLRRRGKVRYLASRRRFYRGVWRSLVNTEPIAAWVRRRRALSAALQTVRRRPNFKKEAMQMLGDSPGYQRWVARLASIAPPADRAQPRLPAQPVAYLLYRYPALSATFIDREMQHLRRAGVPLIVVSYTAGETVEGESLPSLPFELPPLWRRKRRRMRLLRRRPLFALRLLLFIIGTRYAAYKTLEHDLLQLDQALYLADLLAKHNVGHIHSPWANKQAFHALLAARLLNVPYSVQGRAYELYRNTMRHGLAQKLGGARFIASNSRYNCRTIERLQPRDSRAQLHLIYEGIDLGQFTPRPRPVERPVVRLLAVGRLVEQKGFPYLLQACHQLQQLRIAFHCDIIGGEDWAFNANTATELRLLLRRLQLDETVTFHGAQPLSAVIDRMQTADIFVMPSVICRNDDRDITPNVIIEAMALALPVVATTITAIPEMVQHEVSGLLVPPGDSEQLARALQRLIAQPSLRQQLGEAGRQQAQRQFDGTRNYGALARLFAAQGAA